MSTAEIAEFEDEPEHATGVALRRADEAAKVHGLAVDPLEAWLPALAQLT
jgi:hypothetical protein